MDFQRGKWGVLFIFTFVTSIMAQNRTLNRPFQPVVITGDLFEEFTSAPIDQLFLFAYRTATGVFEQIPFQWDEKDVNGDYFMPDDGLLDANDELVFMTRDAGDKAPVLPGPWINDVESTTFPRYEIELTDPLDGSKAWVYLYRSSTLVPDPGVLNYVDYFASNTGNAGEDTIRSRYYELVNDRTGFPKDLTIPVSAGGNGEEILDVLKFRANTSLANIDESNITANSIPFKDGQVRVLRQIVGTLKVNLPFPLPDLDLDFNTPPAFYYPFSISIDIDIPDLPVSVSLARESIDLNANATGMKFVNPHNPSPGLTIDGVPDSPDLTIDDLLPGNNWMYINGPEGTIVHFFPTDPTLGNTRQLFYMDDNSINNNDTGDKMSYGDTGVQISGSISGSFSLDYKGYFLDSNQPSSIGNTLAQFEQNPITIDTTSQRFPEVVPVELVSFTASVQNSTVHLVWLTATETNNFGFEVQRKIQSESDWLKIAFVPGHGTTTKPVRYEYVDRDLLPETYNYRLKQIDTDGTFTLSDILTVVVKAPQSFALKSNYPNPVNPQTWIEYQLPQSPEVIGQRAILKIYNLLGQTVRTLVDEVQSPGFYRVAWDGTNEAGEPVNSGIYIYRLQFGSFVQTRKMIVIR